MANPLNGEAAKDRRRFLKLLAPALAVIILPVLVACAPVKPVALAIHPWVGYETLYLARELKWLPDDVVFLEGSSLSDSYAALQSGQADAACMTLDEMLRARADGIPLSVVLVFDVSTGADMVLARPGIGTPTELAGKRLGLEKNALGILMLQNLLQVADLPQSSLTLVELPPERQLDAWRNNEIDAIITYEPTASQLIHEGAQRIFDSRQMPDTIFDVLAVRTDRTIDKHILGRLVASHFRALEHMRTSRQDALYRISMHEYMSVDEVQQVMAGVTMPSLAANRGYLMGQDSLLIKAARTLSTTMMQYGLLAQEDNLEGLIMADLLPGDER